MLAGKGIMVNWSNWTSALPEDREAWRRWHAEHMVGRLKLPGFIRGRRYGAVEANRGKMTFYELEAPDTLATDAYRQKAKEPFGQPEPEGGLANPNSIRNIAAVKHSLGAGMGVGGFALTLRLDVLPGNEERFSQHLATEVLPAVAEFGEVTGAHFCLSDEEASSIIPTSLEGRMTVGPRWIVMVEGMTLETLNAAFDAHLSALDRHGCMGPIEPNTYKLEVLMTL